VARRPQEAIPGPRVDIRQPEQRISGLRSRFAGRSKQILGRATRSTPERRLAACAPSKPYQFAVLGFPTTIRSFHSIITRQRRSALAYTPPLIAAARSRILIEHAMFRTRHQDYSGALICDLDLACKVWHT
jgi:hypothetical protein